MDTEKVTLTALMMFVENVKRVMLLELIMLLLCLKCRFCVQKCATFTFQSAAEKK